LSSSSVSVNTFREQLEFERQRRAERTQGEEIKMSLIILQGIEKKTQSTMQDHWSLQLHILWGLNTKVICREKRKTSRSM